MSRVIPVSPSVNAARLNVVFVHGLNGGWQATWKRGVDQFFPAWIANEYEDLGVYSVEYDASPSRWLGEAMPLSDRANELLETLRVNGIFKIPTVIVAHSLGGILVKKMLHLVVTQNLPEWAEAKSSVHGVVFLSTPHAGADMAAYLRRLNVIFHLRLTDAALELEKNSAQLRELSTWFRNHCSASRLRCRVYFEKRDTLGIRVVDESSADPGLPFTIVTPVDADHFEIAKPEYGGLVHLGVLEFVRSVVGTAPRARVPKKSAEDSKAALDTEKKSVVSILDDSPILQIRAINVLNSPQYPIMMSCDDEDRLVPNPAWPALGASKAGKDLPLANRLRGHMFLSVVEPFGKQPHLKCYYAERWGANLIPFFKHPTGRENYFEAVKEHAQNHYQAEVRSTGKAVISVKRNEQYKNELWLYCFEFYSLILPRHYRSSEDHRWLHLDRLTDEKFPEAAVNGDIVRALREHFGSGFHGIERSHIDLTELRFGDT